jgi:hypothetical protein
MSLNFAALSLLKKRVGSYQRPIYSDNLWLLVNSFKEFSPILDPFIVAFYRRFDGVVISSDMVKNVSAKLYEKAVRTVPIEIQEAIKMALDKESNELAKVQLKQMLENIRAAKDTP